MNPHVLFTKTPPLRLFFIAALPGAVSMLASALYQMIDGIFVGRILGETPFAALNLAMPFVIINFSLADLIGVGSSVPISISLGRKEEDTANNLFTCACMMIVASGLFMGCLLFAAAPLLISLMGAGGDFAVFAVQYLRVYALCSPVTTIVFAMDNYLRICGKVRRSMVLNILMSLASVTFEFLFLYIFGWGIWAAALATCLGMILSALLAIIPFFRGKLQLRLCRPRFSLRMVKQIFACGSPNFLNNIAGRITSILMNFLLIRFGGESAVSIYGILMYVEGFVQPLLYGMCDSLQPAVGYNWGAGEYRRVNAIERCCFTASALLSVCAALVIFLFPSQLARLFIQDSQGTLLPAAASALRLFAFTYVTRWFSFASQSFMLAVEKPVYASVISISTALVFPVLLVILLWPLALTGIWLNFAGTSLLAAVLSLWVLLRFRRERKK
ncbi:MAG TPA: oligosaccharide flippase family protein [Candidatus Choladousia intestinigallinarum]|nr:oligosaccharide flippase family protein [Candidatus Choladousia intestinigallinarum]